MATLFAGVKALTGNDPVSKGWKRLAIEDVDWRSIRSTKNAGKPRLSLTVVVVEPESEEGRKVYDGFNFTDDRSIGFARGRLEVISPQTDWEDFQFPDSPEDKEGKERLKEELVGCEFFGMIGHEPDFLDKDVIRAKISRVAPLDKDIEIVDLADEAA